MPLVNHRSCRDPPDMFKLVQLGPHHTGPPSALVLPQLDMPKIVQLELHHTGPPAQAMPSPPDMSKFVQLGPHLTGTTPTPNMFKFVHFVSWTVTKRAVGFQLKCLLVYLTRTLSRFHLHIFNQLSIITSPIGRHNFNDESSRTG